MNDNRFSRFQLALTAMSRWLTPLLIIFLLGSIGLGWLVKSFFILIGLILITPVVVFLGFRWWLQRNLVQDQCPVCQHEFVGLNQSQFRCPNCNEPLTADNKHFQRLTPPGTIDVQAVEVSAQQLKD